MMQRKVNPQWLPKLRGECDLKSAQERQSFKLMKREELKSKKSRVENVLIQQYTVKYGTRASTSRINAFIKATVKDVIEESESGQVTEKMLDSLEMDIRDYLEMIKSESLRRPLTASTTVDELTHDYLAESNGGRSTAPENSSIRKNSNRKSKSVRIAVQHPDVDANHWSVVSAILAIDDDEQTSKEFKSMMSKKNMFKDELDKQSSSMRAKENLVAIEKQRSMEFSKSAASQFEEDNRNMKLMLESRIVREKAMRQAQIAEKEQRRNDEKQLRLNLEHIEIAQIRKLTEDDEEKRRIRRENERKALVAVKAEDVRNRSIRLEELSNQREFESKICRDYDIKMQREEQERANAHQDRMDARSAKHPLERMSIKQRGEMKLEEMRLEKKEEERRTNEEFLSRLEDDKDKERNIANIRRAEIAKSSEFNLNLIGRKKEQRLQDRLEASTSRQNMMIESEIHQAADTARSEMKRQLMRDVKSTLDQQVREFESRKINKEALSGNEISINKDMFQKIQCDSDLRVKLYAKLNPSSQLKNAKTGSGYFTHK